MSRRARRRIEAESLRRDLHLHHLRGHRVNVHARRRTIANSLGNRSTPLRSNYHHPSNLLHLQQLIGSPNRDVWNFTLQPHSWLRALRCVCNSPPPHDDPPDAAGGRGRARYVRGPLLLGWRQSGYAAPPWRWQCRPASDGKIADSLFVVEHMRPLGRLAHLFDRDGIQIGEKGFSRLAHGGINDALEQQRVCVETLRVGGA